MFRIPQRYGVDTYSIKTEKLKELVKEYPVVSGGDDHAVKLHLLPLEVLKSVAKLLPLE